MINSIFDKLIKSIALEQKPPTQIRSQLGRLLANKLFSKPLYSTILLQLDTQESWAENYQSWQVDSHVDDTFILQLIRLFIVRSLNLVSQASRFSASIKSWVDLLCCNQSTCSRLLLGLFSLLSYCTRSGATELQVAHFFFPDLKRSLLLGGFNENMLYQLTQANH